MIQIEKELTNYNSHAGNKDENDIFTLIEYKRLDDTLYMKSTLSNPDVDVSYQTMTWEFYDETGTDIVDTVVWNIAYDEEGDIVSSMLVMRVNEVKNCMELVKLKKEFHLVN